MINGRANPGSTRNDAFNPRIVAGARKKIEGWLAIASTPAILSSFGKESMIMIHLTREMGLRLPIIYHRNHWFPEKNAFADEITQRWQLEVHDWPPSECGIKVIDYRADGPPGTAGTTPAGVIQTVNRYQIGDDQGMDVPNGILEPEDDKPWLCARYDILERPKAILVRHPWDLYLMGQKSCDKDIFEGVCRLNTDSYQVPNGPLTVFPLAEWSDPDVWNYIEEQKMPVQRNRYDLANRREFPDKRFNNDYVRACTRCVDRRQPETVWCPKVAKMIPNVSAQVKDMAHKTDYWEKQEAVA